MNFATQLVVATMVRSGAQGTAAVLMVRIVARILDMVVVLQGKIFSAFLVYTTHSASLPTVIIVWL